MTARETKLGLALAVLAYGAWGVIPIYWKLLGGVAPGEILAHRVAGSVTLGILLVCATGRAKSTLAILRAPASRRAMFASTALIAMNWGMFIWAVTTSHLTQASLGYFMNPLCNALLGRVVLGETLTRAQVISFGFAGAGVLWLILSGDGFPWLALALAGSFSLYGLVRKRAEAGALEGFTIETAIAAPIALVFLATREPAVGTIATGATRTRLLLLGSGMVTAVPLIAFAAAAKRLRYTTLGMVQFLAPSLQLFCAVVLFGEPFPTRLALAFALIGLGALVYAVDALNRSMHRTRKHGSE